MSDFDTLVRLLRRWTHNHDLYVRAAVELLIEHETWIRRAGPRASTSEMAILDLAVALGENRYRFSIMGPSTSRMIATAVVRALGEDR